ncbi:MAG: hypothetical protein N3C12_00550 [Candidatus Binatia bacterium]|nr:hypothetical protein [Candidatus Binatia bacterium]
MTTYEFTRILPLAWEYDASLLTAGILVALALAISPFVALLLRRALSLLARPCGDPPSLPATPVKPRLA